MSIEEYYQNAINKIKNEVNELDEEQLLGTDTDELVQYFFDKYSLPLIEKDTKRETTVRKLTSSSAYRNTMTLEISYPLIMKDRIEEVIKRQSNPYMVRLGGYPPELRGDKMVILVEIGELSQHGEITMQEGIDTIVTSIGQKNDNVRQGNEKIRRESKFIINGRKEIVTKENKALGEWTKKINIKLEKKKLTNEPVVDFKVKKSITALLPPARQKEEYQLDNNKVTEVIDYLINASTSFETTPRVYSRLEEEDLRDILLGILNAIFQGDASGETFSKRGKTDIYLKIKKGDILITECKFWSGETIYHTTIDQLFKYLTWNQNYGIIITFSKNKNFSDVIENTKNAARSHKTFQTYDRELSSKYFITTHVFPDDKKKNVQLHHLLFNIFY